MAVSAPALQKCSCSTGAVPVVIRTRSLSCRRWIAASWAAAPPNAPRQRAWCQQGAAFSRRITSAKSHLSTFVTALSALLKTKKSLLPHRSTRCRATVRIDPVAVMTLASALPVPFGCLCRRAPGSQRCSPATIAEIEADDNSIHAARAGVALVDRVKALSTT